MTTSANKTVFTRDRMKVVVSVNARTKFSIPMNCGGLGERTRIREGQDEGKQDRNAHEKQEEQEAGELMSHAVPAFCAMRRSCRGASWYRGLPYLFLPGRRTLRARRIGAGGVGKVARLLTGRTIRYQ